VLPNRISVIPFARQFRFVLMKARCHDGAGEKVMNAVTKQPFSQKPQTNHQRKNPP
jgi:hypothetical protein